MPIPKKVRKFLIFDDEGYLKSGDCLEDSVIEGEEKLIEVLEEIGEDHPETIQDYAVFEVIPVPFSVETTAVTVTID